MYIFVYTCTDIEINTIEVSVGVLHVFSSCGETYLLHSEEEFSLAMSLCGGRSHACMALAFWAVWARHFATSYH